MNLFVKLMVGTFKVLLFIFLQLDTQRRNSRERSSFKRRHQKGESSSLAADLLIAALLNGGSQ
ncbi:hypothetical protein B9Z32_08925 [Limnohabitans sp. MMS-10A-178]|nr:hypothetical protein B9Z32_08925 [Limnohabitans sp. MMS-10A-178]